MYVWMAGFCTGIIGYLMVNNINLCLLELQRLERYKAAALFVILVLIFETAYCLASLRGMQFLLQYPVWVFAARILAIAFLLIIGIGSLLENSEAARAEKISRNIIRRGYWSVWMHPQQIPFWLFWGMLLLDRGILQAKAVDFIQLSAANCLGSLLSLALYWLYGNRLISYFSLKRTLLKNLVGIICLISAFFLFADILGD